MSKARSRRSMPAHPHPGVLDKTPELTARYFGASTPSRHMRILSAANDEAVRLSRCALSSSAGPASGIVVFVACSPHNRFGHYIGGGRCDGNEVVARAFVSTALQRNATMSVTAGLPVDRRKRAWAAVDSRPAHATN